MPERRLDEGMGCLKGRKKAKEKPGNFKCRKCGAVNSSRKNLCKAKKIKEKD
jgi:hypothetical protein